MQSFRSPGNPSLFRNLVAIQGDCVDCGQNLYPEIFGDPSELCQDCIESAIDPQFTGLCQDCKESENPVSGIAQSEWAQIRSNRSAIRLNCIRVAQNPESSRNRPDCKYRGVDCGRIATTQRSSFWGLRGTERIAEDPRATVWACPLVWAQT